MTGRIFRIIIMILSISQNGQLQHRLKSSFILPFPIVVIHGKSINFITSIKMLAFEQMVQVVSMYVCHVHCLVMFIDLFDGLDGHYYRFHFWYTR